MKNRPFYRNFVLALADIFSSASALLIALTGGYFLWGILPDQDTMGGLLSLPVTVVVINNFSGVYGGHFFSPGVGVGKIEELKRVTLGIMGAYLILTAYLGMVTDFPRTMIFVLAAALFLTVLFVPACRFICRHFLHRFSLFRIKVLIAGAGKMGKIVAEIITDDPFFGFENAGFLDDTVQDKKVLGRLSQAVEISRKNNVDYLILCVPPLYLSGCFNQYLQYFRHVLLLPTDRILPVMWTRAVPLGYCVSFEINNRLQMKYLRFSKAISEIILAACLLPFFIPLGLAIALLIKCTSRGPVFYRATRLGQNGKNIQIWKFRTMYQGADAALETMLENNPQMRKEWQKNFKLENDPRITPLGKLLRKTSLDELPQFWNVLKGDIAIIGPRPIVEEEKHYYGERFKIFSAVKPGITGLWQVSGRNELDYEERVNLDVFYVTNWRLWMDYYIFLKTFIIVLSRRGAR